MNKLNEVIITNKIQITNDVFVIDFKREFSFKPGQIIGVAMKQNHNPRLYSICSGSNEENISILFKVKEDGELTPSLASVNIGDKIWITNVQGKFTFNNEPAWWISTGTGIAPFYCMFKSGQQPLKLIQGGRFKTDIYFSNVFNKFDSYVQCCSQDTGDDVFEGRLTKYISDINEIPTDINYYLCGSTEMVVDVRNLLIKKGVDFNNIITEIYF